MEVGIRIEISYQSRILGGNMIIKQYFPKIKTIQKRIRRRMICTFSFSASHSPSQPITIATLSASTLLGIVL
jgi:hypothetical protein